MERHDVLEAQRVLAVPRGDDGAGVVAAAEVLADAGFRDLSRRDRGPVVDRAGAALRSPVRA